MIASIRNWASVVAVWNLALDQSGGPVELPDWGCERCTGIVTVNDEAHTVSFTRDYYELGQMSRYVQPGAVRIASNHYVTYRYFPIANSTATGRFSTPGLDDVAFLNRDGSRVLFGIQQRVGPDRLLGPRRRLLLPLPAGPGDDRDVHLEQPGGVGLAQLELRTRGSSEPPHERQ